MLGGKSRAALRNVVARFANHRKITDHRVAHLAVCHERIPIHPGCVVLTVPYGFQNVLQVVRNPQWIRSAHTGIASRKT